MARKQKAEADTTGAAAPARFDHQLIDEVIHSRIRLAIISVLVSVDDAEFSFLKEKVNATDGNLSVHLRKLEEAGYVGVEKRFVERKPQTRYRLSPAGLAAFREYVRRLESMIELNK